MDRQLAEQGGDEKGMEIQAGEMVIVAGQTLRALTDGCVRTGVRRVVANEEERKSVVFALQYSWKHDISFDEVWSRGSSGGERTMEGVEDRC